ncbi:MAG TPA: (d)CMP kinase [Flavobacteriales bacterium]|nr:(d)CMP kinase [Flavobacteriales bacterium]
MNAITIAIDGYSSCGKSTLAKQLAAHLGYTYIDSGAMYRAVALHVMEQGLAPGGVLDRHALLQALDGISIRFEHDPLSGHSTTWLNGRNVEGEIRSMAVSQHVTLVSPVPEVRAKLVRLQQELGRGKGVVMDGRDIGTVVFPDAEVKLFMTARPEVRAMRRYNELLQNGQTVDLTSVEENIRQRDLDDTTRAADPLRKASDAVEIDNSDITAEQQFQRALDVVLGKLAEVGYE